MDSMHFYKRGPTWWLKFRDHRHIVRRIRLAGDRRVSDGVGRQIGRLVDCAATGQAMPDDLAEWVTHQLDQGRRDRLRNWGLVDPNRLAANDSLVKQIGAWRDGLMNRGRPESYCEMRHSRAKDLLVVACGFGMYRDIDAERTQQTVAEWKREGKKSDYTIAHYLGAAKAFTRWMLRSRRATYDPLAVLVVSRGKPKKVRWAMNDAEQISLAVGTLSLADHHKMMPAQRSMLYRVALGTGLRASAIRRALVGDVDLEHSVLRATGSGASNKHSTAKPLPGHLIEPLRTFIAGREQAESLFTMPGRHQLARMLREDAAALGITTEGLDFHSLRHSYGTSMARRGVHPKTLMALMDHHSIQITMGLYAHSFPEDEARAVNGLPDLSGVQEKPKAAAG